MKSKTKINKQLKKKTNNQLVKTIIAAKKNKNWLKIAEILAGPRRKRFDINLDQISKLTTNKQVIVIAGKVLSQGDIDKKIKVVALGFSEKAKEKLLKAGCEVSTIIEEIKLNPEAKGVEILK